MPSEVTESPKKRATSQPQKSAPEKVEKVENRASPAAPLRPGQLIEIVPAGDVLHFTGQKAQMELRNVRADTNVTYKIRTTAPKLFFVKPINGII